MKKVLRITGAVFLFFIAAYVFTGVVYFISEMGSYYYPSTAVLPIVMLLLIATLCVTVGICLIKKAFNKRIRRLLLGGVLLCALMWIATPSINRVISSQWEKSVDLKYEGVEWNYFGVVGNTALEYSIENTTDRVLKNVVVIFTCEGTDAEGNDVTWDYAYETERDIEPHNSISIKVMESRLEKEPYKYLSSNVDFLAWDE